MKINYKGWKQLIDFLNGRYLARELTKENLLNDKGLYFNLTIGYDFEPAIAVWDYKKSRNSLSFSGYFTDGHSGLDRITDGIPITRFFENNTETSRRFLKLLDDVGLFGTRKINYRKFFKSDLCDFLLNRNDKWFVLNNSIINAILNMNLNNE